MAFQINRGIGRKRPPLTPINMWKINNSEPAPELQTKALCVQHGAS